LVLPSILTRVLPGKLRPTRPSCPAQWRADQHRSDCGHGSDAHDIEKSPRLHALVMQKIAAVVKKDLTKSMAASKAKLNSRKNKPAAGRGGMPADDRSTTDVMAATDTRGS
jgi:hypothetical protein